ncbi:MAG: hypothetical protein J6B75_05080 [Ruminococcus sp.]|nr:hypothetical protein [Ruminococcus sp.]
MKKLLIGILSAVLCTASISALQPICNDAVIAVSSADGKISAELSEKLSQADSGEIPVWIWLADNDKPDFDALAEEQTAPRTEAEAEKYYALTEAERVDLLKAAKLEIAQEYYQNKNNAFVKAQGITEESIIFFSELTPSIVCRLSADEIRSAAENESVVSINLYDKNPEVEVPTESEPKMTKEEFLDMVISENEDFSDGGFVYRGDLKFDAVPDGNGFDLVVYGIKQEYYTRNVGVSGECLKFDVQNYIVGSTPEFYSGCFMTVKSGETAAHSDLSFGMVCYVEDVLPGFPEPAQDIIEASLYKDIDIAPYIYSEITPGDVDNDGTISASDASLVLRAYGYSSTGKTITLNNDMCDYNGDGVIDAADASAILAKYAELSTS